MCDAIVQAMQLTFAFDEVLAFGNRENSSLTNIKTALEMDSNEEKVFKMNQMAQEKQAKELASKRAKEIDQERVARAKSNLMGFGSNSDKRDSFGSAPSDFSRMTVNLTCTPFPLFLPPPRHHLLGRTRARRRIRSATTQGGRTQEGRHADAGIKEERQHDDAGSARGGRACRSTHVHFLPLLPPPHVTKLLQARSLCG